jgi:DNA-binding GntR family transcriptional regulator
MMEQPEPIKTDLVVLRSSSLSAAIEAELQEMILKGQIKPGERLNELQLSTRFGTSRGPLREALRSLQGKGLVSFVRNRGVFVRAISPEEALEIYDLRAAIFGLAGRLLADLVNDTMLETLDTYLARMDAASEARDFAAYFPINLAFHEYLVGSTGNSLLQREYKMFVDKLHLCRGRGLVQAGGLSVSNREHREMVDAIAAGNRERAFEAFFRHVERAKQRFKSTLDNSERSDQPDG